jgi:hypothetical protein
MPPPIEYHCPFGCKKAECNEYGHCYHLVGFSNDGKVYEKLTKRPDGAPMVGGFSEITLKDHEGNEITRMSKNMARVLPGDIVVNPEHKQILDGGFVNVAKKWVSSRIYRNVPKPPATPEEQEEARMLREERDAAGLQQEAMRRLWESLPEDQRLAAVELAKEPATV